MAKKEDKIFLEKINISFDKLLLGNMGIIAIFLVALVSFAYIVRKEKNI